MQLERQAGLQTHLLHSSPEKVTSDTKSMQTKPKRIRQGQEPGLQGTLCCLRYCAYPVGVVKWQVAAVGGSESTGLHEDRLDCHTIESILSASSPFLAESNLVERCVNRVDSGDAHNRNKRPAIVYLLPPQLKAIYPAN